jgi:hypothetical protein
VFSQLCYAIGARCGEIRRPADPPQGIDSELVVLDNIVDATMSSVSDHFTSSGDQGVAQLGQDFYDQLAARLGERIRECGARVPVITGRWILLASYISSRWDVLRDLSDEVQATLALFLALFSPRLAEGTPTSALRSPLLASTPRSSRCGRKSTVSSLPTLARSLPPVSCPSSHPTKLPN